MAALLTKKKLRNFTGATVYAPGPSNMLWLLTHLFQK